MDTNHLSDCSGEREKEKKEDKKQKLDEIAPSGPFSPVFHINELKIGNLENASAVNIGNNYPTNFRGYKRHNQGLGTIEGNHNDIHDLNSHMNQRLLMDALLDSKEELPQWVIDLMKEHASEPFANDAKVEDEIQNTFKQIKGLLAVENVPLFFKKLSHQHSLLAKILEYVQVRWNSHHEFESFYLDVLKMLNEIHIPEVFSPDYRLPYEACKQLADHIEEHAKGLFVVIHLTRLLLPGYLLTHKDSSVDVSFESFETIETLTTNQILELLKTSFNVKELPVSLSSLKEHPEAFKYGFLHIVHPVMESKNGHRFLSMLKHLFVEKAEVLEDELPLHLTHEEQAFLITHLIYCLHHCPKYLLLEYLFLPLCE